ncbi:hypothetical protein [Histidinibacterium aquaticum]|uniref:Uncharacterized protein n=1 Tax=Histidinibacterium aquaticum TaxID=2613962 RepID=A0A5J5GMZ1_9RHOB|nr:hypothetical protein [Histidinibacterium aquaticum]KAA9009736.1 hypothetical protein F3S47_00220 [Histidinibacterium aquaticum]
MSLVRSFVRRAAVLGVTAYLGAKFRKAMDGDGRSRGYDHPHPSPDERRSSPTPDGEDWRDWSEQDERLDETFPASDATAKY